MTDSYDAFHLLLISVVLLACEVFTSLMKYLNIHFIPKAGGCILIGSFVGLLMYISEGGYSSNYNNDQEEVEFQDQFFLQLLLPPIVFQAALSVNKSHLRKRRLPILMYAVVGTILSTIIIAAVVYFASNALSSATSLPLLDSLVFGSLISNIDPVAILSIMKDLNVPETDAVFMLLLGESIMNDAISITMFQELVLHYSFGYDVDGDGITDDFSSDYIFSIIADFLIAMVASLFIGLVCGAASLLYFWTMKRYLSIHMEVCAFFLLALLAYYIADVLGLSGIVSLVTIGIFLDIYIGPNDEEREINRFEADVAAAEAAAQSPNGSRDHIELSLVKSNDEVRNYSRNYHNDFCDTSTGSKLTIPASVGTYATRNIFFQEFKYRMSTGAYAHVRFVAFVLSHLSQDAIFAYLGIFLFGQQYIWNLPLVSIAASSCIVSRVVTVVLLAKVVYIVHWLRQKYYLGGCCDPKKEESDYFSDIEHIPSTEPSIGSTVQSLQGTTLQFLLILSGLRGAVSLALVESIPKIENSNNGGDDDFLSYLDPGTIPGSQFKPELRAMTTATILVSIFGLGGSAHFFLVRLGIGRDN